MSEIRVSPFWRIISAGTAAQGKGKTIILSDGPGWGSGSHETTQLCLQAIAFLSPRKSGGFRMLDFGSGSGILSVAGAKLGAIVEAVEIDESANENARLNARLNGVEGSVRFQREIPASADAFDLVVANILRPVLVEFAPQLAGMLSKDGTLVLSGLVATDVPELTARFSGLPGLRSREPEIYQSGDWRALVWRNS